jgi:ATP-dependent Zn protease
MTKISLAYHEAGHAVIARMLWIEVRLATIRPNKFFDGHVTLGASWLDRDDANGTNVAEDREEEWRRRIEMAEDRAKLALAGPIAEMKYRPTLNGEDFADYSDLFDVAVYLKIAGGFSPISEVLVPGKPLQQTNREVSRLWERLQADTADLVELHWPSIERVAEALLIHEELGQKEIEALVY